MRNLDRTSLAKKHAGKWVAFKKDRKTVIAFGTNAESTLRTARRKGVDHPIITRMPAQPIAFIGAHSLQA